MDTIERIKETVENQPVVIFMKGSPDFPQCGFSARASEALKACGANFAYVNIYEDEAVYRALPQYSNWPTFPQLFIKGELIGGHDIMMDLFEQGELKKMVQEAVGEAA
ncbi:MAG: Grx4 family monothiol glutaredoxin [Nevskiales bacterium]